MKTIQLKDSSLAGSRLDLFLIVLVGAYIVRRLGFHHLLIWLPGLLACLDFLTLWLLSVVNPGKVSSKVFFTLWWSGVALLIGARMAAIFIVPDNTL